MYLRKIVLPRS